MIEVFVKIPGADGTNVLNTKFVESFKNITGA